MKAGYNRTFMEDPKHAADEYFASTGGKVRLRNEVRRQMSLVGEGILGAVRAQGYARSCGHMVTSEAVAAHFKRDKALLGIDVELPVLAPQHSMDCMFNHRRVPGSNVFEEEYYPYTGLPSECKEKTTRRDTEKI